MVLGHSKDLYSFAWLKKTHFRIISTINEFIILLCWLIACEWLVAQTTKVGIRNPYFGKFQTWNVAEIQILIGYFMLSKIAITLTNFPISAFRKKHARHHWGHKRGWEIVISSIHIKFSKRFDNRMIQKWRSHFKRHFGLSPRPLTTTSTCLEGPPGCRESPSCLVSRPRCLSFSVLSTAFIILSPMYDVHGFAARSEYC